MTETSEQGYDFIISRELNPRLAHTSKTSRMRESVTEKNSFFRDLAEDEGYRSEDIPTDLNNFISQEREQIMNYLETNGVKKEKNNWSKVYYVPQLFDNPDQQLIARSGFGFVRLPGLPIEIRWIKLYQEAIIAAHELYHDSAPSKLHPIDIYPYFRDERKGMAYINVKNDTWGVTALEEGLAYTWQLNAEKRARKMFPKGAEDFDMALHKAIAAGVVDKDKNIFTIVSWNLQNEI
jgi:hypothetical protein